MSFFGFDTSLPDDRRSGPSDPSGSSAFGFQARADQDAFGGGALGAGAGEQEDLAVYQWGEGMDTGLLEGGDDMNDETFGDVGNMSADFQFSSQPQHQQQHKPRIASTQSHFRPKAAVDLFAATEDDFYSSRPSTTKSEPG